MRLAILALLTLPLVGCLNLSLRRESRSDAGQVRQASYRAGDIAERRPLNRLLSVPLDQEYDLYCTLLDKKPTVFRRCRILGVVGQESTESGSFSKKYIPNGEWYDGMLVLETPGGRRVYLPTATVRYFEESSPTMQADHAD